MLSAIIRQTKKRQTTKSLPFFYTCFFNDAYSLRLPLMLLYASFHF